MNHLLSGHLTVVFLKTATLCNPGNRDSSYPPQKAGSVQTPYTTITLASLWQPDCLFAHGCQLLCSFQAPSSCPFPTQQKTAQMLPYLRATRCPHTAREGEPGRRSQGRQGCLGMALRNSTCPVTSTFMLGHTDIFFRLSHHSFFLPKHPLNPFCSQ